MYEERRDAMLTVSMRQSTLEQLKRHADMLDRSVSWTVDMVIRQALNMDNCPKSDRL